MADRDQTEPEGTGPTARRIILGAQLRRLRERAGVARSDAAWSIRGSDSKMSRLEAGKVGFKERDVADLLTLYGITDDAERELLLDTTRRSNEPGWWQPYGDVLPDWFEDYVGLEMSASRIQTYELMFVPGPAPDRGLRPRDHHVGPPGPRDARRRAPSRRAHAPPADPRAP